MPKAVQNPDGSVSIVKDPPVAPGSVTLSPIISGFSVDLPAFPTGSWGTFKEYRVYASTTSGFTPGAGNLVANGPSRHFEITKNITPNVTYYVKCTAVDTEDEESDPSTEGSVTTGRAVFAQIDEKALLAILDHFFLSSIDTTKWSTNSAGSGGVSRIAPHRLKLATSSSTGEAYASAKGSVDHNDGEFRHRFRGWVWIGDESTLWKMGITVPPGSIVIGQAAYAYIQKGTNAETMKFVTEKNDTDDTIPPTVTDNIPISPGAQWEYEIRVTSSSVKLFVNGVERASHTDPNAIPNQPQSPYFALDSGSEWRELVVDYSYFWLV